jgi:ADP-heptose:LPS heptosyltransferase
VLDEPFVWKGARGLFKHAYHTAAEVAAFQIVIDRKTLRGTLTGQAGACDVFLLAQRPLVFVMPTTRGQPRRWPVESVQVVENQIVARLGVPEG